MPKYNVVITLFTIVYGLMLADLFLSFHKLFRVRKNVKWHWLPLLAAWYLFLIILNNWWNLSSFQDSVDSMNIFFFIAYGHLLFLLFLLVSTALPDVKEGERIDLKDYYFKNHRYFWGLMIAVVVLSTLIVFLKQIGNLGQIGIFKPLAVGVFLLLLAILTITRKYWVHCIFLVLFVIETIFEIFS